MGGSVRFMVLIWLLLHVTSCARPQLIENSKLNQERIYEVIERASAASGLRVLHPLSVKLIGRDEVSKLLQEHSGELGTTIQDLKRLAKQARVTTRAELAAHFANAT
ncbi:MAG: hypothetical protein H0V35_04210 [Nitrospira sp.]|nr:hypothetical protein [Nitrospira sp.]